MLIRYVVALTLLVLPAIRPADAQTVERTAPAVAYGGLEDRGRVLSIALYPGYWAAYDLARGSLFRLWMGSREHTGGEGIPGYPGHAGIRGQVLQRDRDGIPWRLRVRGRELTPDVVFQGYRRAGVQVLLSYGLQVGDSLRVTVEELPEVVPDDAGVVQLRRRFVVTEAPDGVEVLHHVAVEHLTSRERLGFDGFFLREEGRRHRHVWGITYDVEGWAVLDTARPSVLTAQYAPGVLRQEAREHVTEANRSFRNDPPVALRGLAGLTSEPRLRRSPAHVAGVTVRIYRIGTPMDSIPSLAPGQLPNVHVVRGDIDMVADADFGGERFYFLSRITGFLNLSVEGTYVFRVRADDGARLAIDGHTVLDHDGLHPAAPSPAAEVTLGVGIHPFAVDHFQSTGDRRFTLEWMPPWSDRFTPVDPDVLSTPREERVAVSGGRKLVRYDVPALADVRGVLPVQAMHPAYSVAPVRGGGRGEIVGGLALMADGRLAVSTWEAGGTVAILRLDEEGGEVVSTTQVAAGLDHPLGLAAVDGRLHVMQTHELTRLVDDSAAPGADRFQALAGGWQRPAFYRSYAFGLAHRDGVFFGTLSRPVDAQGAMFIEPVPDAGLLVRMDGDGGFVPLVEGFQMPAGLAADDAGNLYVSDYRNAWFGASRIVRVPAAQLAHGAGDRVVEVVPADSLTLVWLPEGPEAFSPGQPVVVRHGRYAGHLLFGDLHHDRLYRATIEQVEGRHQGAVYPFTDGTGFRAARIVEAGDGTLYVGSARFGPAWGRPVASERPGLYRLRPTDAVPFELSAMHARSNGFELVFSAPVGRAEAADPASYTLLATTPDGRRAHRRLAVADVVVSDDRTRVWLETPSLEEGSVVHLVVAPSLRSAAGDRLWSNEAWYTLHRIPADALGMR